MPEIFSGGYAAENPPRTTGQYPTVQHSNKLTLKGLLCALSRHPYQH